MKRTNVLYITYDGVLEPIAQSQVLNYIRGLSREGFNFYLVSFEKKENLRDKDYLSRMEEKIRADGITWLRLKYHARPKPFAAFFDILHGGVFCLLVALRKRVRIIHARAEMPAAMALPASLLLRARFIYDRRGVMAYDYVEGGLWPKNSVMTRALCSFINLLDKIFLNSADRVVVLSRKMETFLKNELLRPDDRDKVSVIPCCVDTDKFRSLERKAGEDKFVLLYSGSLGTWNMLKEMVDFFLELKRHRKGARLLILTLSARELIDRAVGGRLEKGDYSVGGGRYEEMPGDAAAADAGIIFRIPGFAKTAASPTKFGEYLACGLPVVVNSGIGDTEELVRKNALGVVVNNFRVDDYGSAAGELLRLFEEEKTLRQRCRDAAIREFSLDSGVRKYLDIYEALR